MDSIDCFFVFFSGVYLVWWSISHVCASRRHHGTVSVLLGDKFGRACRSSPLLIRPGGEDLSIDKKFVEAWIAPSAFS